MLRLIAVTSLWVDQHPSAQAGRSRTAALKRAGGLSLLLRLVVVAGTFLTTPVLVHGLSVPVYGVFATITATSALLQFSDLGVGNGLLTRLAAAESSGDVPQARRLITVTAVILCAAGLLLAVLGLLLVLLLPIPRLFSEGTNSPHIRLACAIFVAGFSLGIPSVLGQRILTAKQRGGAAAFWGGVIALVVATCTAGTAYFGGGLVAVTAAATLPPVLIGYGQTARLFRRQYPELRPRRTFLDRVTLRLLLRSSSAFLVLQLAAAAAFETDLLVISAVRGTADAATYAVCLKLFAFVSLFVAVAPSQFWPATADALAKGDLEWVRKSLNQFTLFCTAVATVGSGALVLLGQPFVRLWIGAELVPPTALLLAMALWMIWVSALVPAGLMLNGAHVLRVQVLTAIAMVLVNLPLSLFLTFKIGLAGPVVASLTASIVTTGLPVWRAASKLLTADNRQL